MHVGQLGGVTGMFWLLWLYLVGQQVYVFTSKIASADLVAPLSLTTCHQWDSL